MITILNSSLFFEDNNEIINGPHLFGIRCIICFVASLLSPNLFKNPLHNHNYCADMYE